jgi:hypothetical protein
MSLSVERREDGWVVASLRVTVALVRLTTETGCFAIESEWFARLTGSSAGCEARVRTDLEEARVLAVLPSVEGAAAYSRGARTVGWRRDSCGAGLGGIGGVTSSSWKGFPIMAGLVHDAQPLVQPGLPQPELQQMGPWGTRQSRTQPIFFTVLGMMQSNWRPQQGRQQLDTGEPQLGAREPQLGAHVLQLGTCDTQLVQPQPSLPRYTWG